jgi:hypothetical protein
VPLSPSAVNNATNYALTVENLEATNSRALNVLKSDGSTLIKADATGVTLGSPITAPAASLPGSVLQNGSVANAALGSDVARLNLLPNGGFEIWQRGNGPFTGIAGNLSADRWVFGGAGTDTVSISKDTANVASSDSNADAAVTFTLGTGAGGSHYVQILKSSEQPLFGAVLSFSAMVRTATANAVRLGCSLDNGTTWTYSAYHVGDGAYHLLNLTSAAVAAGSVGVQVGFFFAASCTAYLDNAMLVIGSQYASFVPPHPADDLARCLRYYEVVGASAAGNVMFSGYLNAAGTAYNTVWFKAVKAIVPTVTKNGTWSVSNASQPSLTQAGTDSTRMDVGITAAGQWYCQNLGGGCNVTAEANP